MSINTTLKLRSDEESYALGLPFFQGCLSLVILSGCCLNILVIFAILTNAKMRVRENVLHFNLACIDVTLLVIASFPMVITHITVTYSTARNEISINSQDNVPRRVSVSAIVLDMFQTNSEIPTNNQTPTAQPSPHFVYRRHLVMTTFILITCSILLLIVPIGVGSLFFETIPMSVPYFSITLNSCLTPVIYIWRYHHFRNVIFDIVKRIQIKCRCGTRVDTH